MSAYQVVISIVLLLAPIFAPASDRCLADAVAHVSLTDVKGQIVLSVLTPAGVAQTQVLASKQAGAARLSGAEGFRIASVTKTYVAATALRLYEAGKLDLTAPISRLIAPEWVELLRKDGYDVDRITVRHLLSHTAGLADHARTPQFIDAIKEHPQTEWTRQKSVQSLVEWTDPVAAPGAKFSYSDTGYILLGSIIERITGQDLPRAVRAQLNLDTRAPESYWERYEQPRGAARAHQTWEGRDTYDWNPSLDLFGGGGVVASMHDVAVFFDELLRGKVFARPETLELMRATTGLPADSPYGLGLFRYDFEGVQGFGHSGFWGTFVVYEPLSQRTIAGSVTDTSAWPVLKQLVGDYVRRAAKSAAPGAESRSACTSADSAAG